MIQTSNEILDKIFERRMKFGLRYDKEKLEKLRFQKMILDFFYNSCQDFFQECDDSNNAKIYFLKDHSKNFLQTCLNWSKLVYIVLNLSKLVLTYPSCSNLFSFKITAKTFYEVN